MAESLNDLWVGIQLELRMVEELTHNLPNGGTKDGEAATYGGRFDYCRQAEQIHSRLESDLRHTRSAVSGLKYRLQEFHNQRAKAKEEPNV